MRRKLLLIGVPVLVLVFWALSGLGGTRSDAEVDISSNHPVQLRDTVLATVTDAGGQSVSEDTSYDGGGSSQLTFKLPTARIEEATQALAQLGDHITHQRVDLASTAVRAAGVNQQLTDARSCVDGLSAVGSTAGRTQLTHCQNELATITSQISNSKVDLTTSTLTVKITAPRSVNVLLIVAICLVLAVAVGLALMVRRLDDQRPMVPVSEVAHFTATHADRGGDSWN